MAFSDPSAPSVAFDMEGPLCPTDYAYDLFAFAIEDGADLFAALSRYDDLLALGGRTNYEPGDTIALMLPFLASRIDYDAAVDHANQHSLVLTRGASSTIKSLQGRRQLLKVITTAPSMFATRVVSALELPLTALDATEIDAATWGLALSPSLVAEFRVLERNLLSSIWEGEGPDDAKIMRSFERFFRDLSGLGAPYPGNLTRAIGGRRKVTALEAAARAVNIATSRIVYVGDSITDVEAFKYVDAAGGLSLAFNGNGHAIAHATVAVGSLELTQIVPVIDSWFDGGRAGVETYVDSVHGRSADLSIAWMPPLAAAEREEVANAHLVFRRAARGAAGDLG